MTLERFQEVEEFNEAIEGPLSFLSEGILFMQIFLAYGLKYLWNLVNLFQFLVFFLQWKINMDEETRVVLEILKSFALFEFIDTTAITNEARAFFRGVEVYIIECEDGTLEDDELCMEVILKQSE